MAQRDLVRAGVAKLLALERRGGTCEVSHYGESRREGGGGGEDENPSGLGQGSFFGLVHSC